VPRLAQQVKAAEAVRDRAVMEGVPVKMPHLYAKKNPKAAFQRGWFWLFPQIQPCVDPRTKGRVWWHCLDTTVQRAMRTANRRAGVDGITPHHLRHAWATYAHADGAHLRDLQEVLGHKNIETTARYVRPDPERVPSPLESMHLVA
jgi:integrase